MELDWFSLGRVQKCWLREHMVGLYWFEQDCIGVSRVEFAEVCNGQVGAGIVLMDKVRDVIKH